MSAVQSVTENATGFIKEERQLALTDFVQHAETEPSENPVHVISMIPGIRDLGVWIDKIDYYSRKNGLRIKAAPVYAGRTNTIKFIMRLGARHRDLEILCSLLSIRLLYPNA